MLTTTSRISFALVAAWLVLPQLAHGDSPRLAGARPAGLQRGELTELTFNGTALKGETHLLAPFDFDLEGEPQASEDGKSWTIRLKPSPSTRLGLHLVRVQTTEGLSNVLPLEIGQFPQTQEAEPNDSHEAAQEVGPTPVVIDGRAEGSDVDYFRFKGSKGQKLVVDVRCARIGSGLDPQIRLTTVANRFIAASDDAPGLATDALLITSLPEDGDYVLEISDTKYQGTGRPDYRILLGEIPLATSLYPLGGRQGETVGFELEGGTLDHPALAVATLPAAAAVSSLPFPADVPSPIALITETLPTIEVGNLPELREPEDASASPLRVVPPVFLNGRISHPGEEDRYTVIVKPGEKLQIELVASELGSPLDGVLRVLKPDGAQVATGDDTTIKALDLPGQKKPPDYVVPDPSLEVAAPEGTTELTLALTDLQGRGGSSYSYRLKVSPVVPRFELQMAESELNLPRGGSAHLAFAVTRSGGFQEPVKVTLPDLPSGVTAQGGVVASDQSVGWLSLSANSEIEPEARELQVVGHAQKGETAYTSPAVRVLTIAEQANIPIKTVEINTLAVAPAPAQPIVLEAPEEPQEAPHGQETLVTFKINRSGEEKSELTFTVQGVPKGVEGPELKVPADQNEAKFKFNIKPEATLGQTSIAIVAKGKINDKDVMVAAPAVTLDVVAPVSLELTTAGPIEVKTGETAEVRGKLTRRGSFKDPVTIKLEGLPAGVKAEPVTLEPDKDEFTLRLTADADAAPAEATAKVTPAFKIADKDYPYPAPAVPIKLVKP